ncbi:MAG: hypothetical protein IKW62_04440, partial [Clostridia bacterium]|nr:hypothetical protein [Clostridia bacterium]
MATVKEKMTAIADAMRKKTSKTDKLTLDDMANAVEDVYDAGSEVQKKAFWDAFTNNNTRTLYPSAFRGSADGCLDAPYPIIIRNAEACFRDSSIKKITDRQVDLSRLINFPYGFHSSKIEELETINLSSNSNNAAVFYLAKKLHTIKKFIVAETSDFTKAPACFSGASGLKNITVEGSFGTNISFSYCSQLTSESVESIVAALSGTSADKTLTL